jgi:hypothetical protein
MDNLLPNNPLKLEQLIRATDSVDLSAFADFVAFRPVGRTHLRRSFGEATDSRTRAGGGAAARRRAVPHVSDGSQS